MYGRPDFQLISQFIVHTVMRIEDHTVVENLWKFILKILIRALFFTRGQISNITPWGIFTQRDYINLLLPISVKILL